MVDLKPKQKIELSKADHGKAMAAALIEGMIQNPDTVLRNQAGGQMEVYKELLRDDQVKSCFQQRRTATVQSEWEVEPASESAEDTAAAEFIRQQLKTLKFDAITDQMLYAIHYGYGVAEKLYYMTEDNRVGVKIKVRDRNRFGFGIEDELILIKSDGQRQTMPRSKFWVFSVGADHSDNQYGEGLAHSLYWPVFFKRNGIKFWLIYLEKFGMPTATAKLSQAQINDPAQRAMALDILDAIQADSGVTIPEDFVVELLEASRSGTADYNTLRDSMDAAIAKIILSQTMTTDSGSSYSQANVHQDVRNEVIKSDADLICDSFNRDVIKDLVELNFPNAKPPTVWRKTEPEKDLAAIAERDNKILNLGYEPTEEYIEETYGPGWRKTTNPAPPIGQNATAMGPEFAEVTPLTDKRVQHRRDQQSLIDASEYLATKYRDIYGDRVEQLISYLEETDDPETFKQRLMDMIAEPAPEVQVDAIRNATWASRLMGILKGAR